jgi:NTP pyrophosphatase (non-canonical NTP hydrolase)
VTFNEYQIAAFQTAKRFMDLPTDLAHAALGLATESGEFATEAKRAFIYGKPIDDAMRRHMLEELGDILWYVAMACEHLEVPLHSVAKANIDKLQKRYPERYSDGAAEARADKGGVGPRES